MAKPRPIRDAAIGAVVFMITPMDTDDALTCEVRETYYTKISADRVLHHGCIQGLRDTIDGEAVKPRYINIIFPAGFEYALIPSMPVSPIEQARWSDWLK